MLRTSSEKRIHIPILFSPKDPSEFGQRTISLRAQLRLSYETYPQVRYLTWAGMALLGLLLLLLPGFPPRVFLLFWQTLPLIGRLMAQHGSAALLSLATLGIQALTWLLLWGLWIALSYALARYTVRLAQTRNLLGTGWLPSSVLDNGQARNGERIPISLSRTAPLPPPVTPPAPVAATSAKATRSTSPAEPEAGPISLLRTSQHQSSPHASQANKTPQITPPTFHENKTVASPPQASVQQPSRQFIQPTLILARPHAQSLTGETLPGWPAKPGLSGPGVAWDVGITRKGRPNEDSVLTMRGTCSFEAGLLPFELHIVADGMGGHAHGRLASHLALRGMVETVVPGLIACKTLENERIVDILIDGVQWANQVIYQYGQEQGTDMGTTITAVLLLNKIAYIINVGDSRTYVYRPRAGLTQITRDHSLVARMVENGTLAPEEIYTHPERNKVYRGLGDKTEVTVDWFVLPVQSGDLLLLCSDGLWEMVRDPQMAGILTTYAASPRLASDALLQAALQAGGNDNVSLLVVGV